MTSPVRSSPGSLPHWASDIGSSSMVPSLVVIAIVTLVTTAATVATSTLIKDEGGRAASAQWLQAVPGWLWWTVAAITVGLLIWAGVRQTPDSAAEPKSSRGTS